MTVDIFCLILGVNNSLILIKTVISGSSIADGYGNQIEGYSLKSEHFKSNKDGSDRAVGYAAENSSHTAGSTDRRRKEEERKKGRCYI